MKAKPKKSAARKAAARTAPGRKIAVADLELDARRSQIRVSARGAETEPTKPRPDTGGKPASLYEPLDFFVLRAPRLPVERYIGLSRPPETSGPSPNLLALCSAELRCALAVGNPSLLEALTRTVPGSPAAAGVRSKLLRFQIRVATRPTPFGLYAGLALAHWGASTNLKLASTRSRRTRPDMGWLMSLVMRLEQQPEIRKSLRVSAHQALVVRAGRVSLPDREPAHGVEHRENLSVEATALVRQVLSLVRAPMPYGRLIAKLRDSTVGASRKELAKVVDELLQLSILITDLRPSLASASPARQVVERLEQIPAAAEARTQLAAICDAATHWDGLPAQDAVAAFQEMASQAHGLSGKASEPAFQVDAALSLQDAQLHRAVGEEVARAAQVLLGLAPFPMGMPFVEDYRNAFLARYSQDQEVPLLELLDPHLGIALPGAEGVGAEHRLSASKHEVLQELALSALHARRTVLELDAKTLERLRTNTPDRDTVLPAMELFVSVAARSAHAIDQGEFQVVIGPAVGTPGASCSLGRFADLLGDEARTAIESTCRREEELHTDRIFAELVYMPRTPRLANVAIRPLTRTHQISVGISPQQTGVTEIPLAELVVGVRGKRFFLRWPAAGKDVNVSVGHLLNNHQAPPVCRFIAEMVESGVVHLSGFSWGKAEGFPFLPRVQTGKTVLRLAQWRIDASMRDAHLRSDSAAAFAKSIGPWRERWQVPRHVYLSASDNRLLLDLDDADQREELREAVRHIAGEGVVLLQEVFPALDQAWTEGEDGHYLAELAVPLVLRRAATESRSPIAPASPKMTPGLRLRPPGSDWLYLKLYAGHELGDDLIAGPIRKFCRKALAAGLAEDWFFLRYSDPDAHLRIRFRGDPKTLSQSLMPEVCRWATRLMADGSCVRFGFDTYDRELERYGGPQALEAAEALFGADSRAVADLLASLKEDRTLHLDRTVLAVVTTEDLLTSLGMNDEQRLAWYQSQIRSRHDGGTEYRDRKSILRPLLAGTHLRDPEQVGEGVAKALRARARILRPVGKRMLELQQQQRLCNPLSGIYAALVHMHVNRLMVPDPGFEAKVLALLWRVRLSLSKGPMATGHEA